MRQFSVVVVGFKTHQAVEQRYQQEPWTGGEAEPFFRLAATTEPPETNMTVKQPTATRYQAIWRHDSRWCLSRNRPQHEFFPRLLQPDFGMT